MPESDYLNIKYTPRKVLLNILQGLKRSHSVIPGQLLDFDTVNQKQDILQDDTVRTCFRNLTYLEGLYRFA